MFISLYLNTDPFWLVWAVFINLTLLLYLYGEGVLLIGIDGRYYGATGSKAFADVTDLYFMKGDYYDFEKRAV